MIEKEEIISERQSLHHCQKCHKVAENSTGFAADKLGYVGVFLLRHY